MDISGGLSVAVKVKAVYFAIYLSKTYSGNISGLDFESEYEKFEVWYQKEVVEKNAHLINERPF